MAELEYRSEVRPQFFEDKSKLHHKRAPSIVHIGTLDDLVQELHRVFESDEVNVEYVLEVMSAYCSRPKEWLKYAKFDRHRYTRNLVDEGNGKFNLMVLAWSEGQGSSIHDHANSHCFMKVLSGSLTEVRFAWPKQQEGVDNQEMEVIRETELRTNDVTYMNDSLGLHRMENKSHSEPAVTLHLYSPPFETVQIFDQRTGHKSLGKVTFWSKHGKRTPFAAPCTKLDEEDYENN